MASGLFSQDGLGRQNVNKQLALAVRSIQWSYAVFWSMSTEQPGVLDWGDGYYNGDIKTRKTVQTMEIEADELGLQRSEQLRELYDFLSDGEANLQSRRPSAALSPEDLTDTEWYYLVCMSFLFNIGQGLPGRSLAKSQQIWLCNAHCADSKVFTRSLLAKSASIQTVVCFPVLRGVLEIGSTEKVSEDYRLIQHIRSLFLDNPDPLTSEKWITEHHDEELDEILLEARLVVPGVNSAELEMAAAAASHNDSSNDEAEEDSFIIEGIDGGSGGGGAVAEASQVESWLLMDDDDADLSPPGLNHSLNSSESISQTIADPENFAAFPPSDENVYNTDFLQESEACKNVKMDAPGLPSNDFHYQSVLSSVLKTSHPLILGPHLRNSHQASSFLSWKKAGSMHQQHSQNVKCGIQQKMLKKVLFDFPQKHIYGYSPENGIIDGDLISEADEVSMNQMLSERKQREVLDERLMILKSMVPSVNKVDRVSILDETIKYLQELESRVEQLGTQQRQMEPEVIRTERKTNQRISSEKTSDNYGSTKRNGSARKVGSKRKATETNEMRPKIKSNIASKVDSVSVSMNMKGPVIKVHCPWREGILLLIMDELTRLRVDSHSVQSSTTDGILSLTIESEHKGVTGGAPTASAGAIKRALERVAMGKKDNL
ncbi:unnamed protein product [Linum tenue]|uniref:BHLH domain-containing protein n=1 Tax=Linum tenue TaxID=586396 RepID=A0AAV0JXJ2_9ROSI|nr:unnamed protein product [Linum tenue]